MSDGFQREGRMINVFVRSFGAQHIIYSHLYRVDSARLLELPFWASRRGIFCASLCERWWLETTFPTRGGLKSTNHWVKSFLHKTGATSPWRTDFWLWHLLLCPCGLRSEEWSILKGSGRFGCDQPCDSPSSSITVIFLVTLQNANHLRRGALTKSQKLRLWRPKVALLQVQRLQHTKRNRREPFLTLAEMRFTAQQYLKNETPSF